MIVPSLVKSQSSRRGFTIVELLVVIVVIGILAAITIVSYTGISQKATVASLQSDLSNSSNKLKMFYVDNSSYPATIDCTIPNSTTNLCLGPSSGVVFQYVSNNNSNPQTFSLVASKNSTKYRISNDISPKYTPQVVATGGTITDLNGYRIHTFTTSGTFTVTSGDNVEVLVVAGGGGGGTSQTSNGGAGGGGAGGLIYSTAYSVTSQAYTVTIGNGGAAGGVGLAQPGVNGGNSVFDNLVAIGGGYGSEVSGNGGNGGSGGGGGYNGYSVARLGGTGVTGQGNVGGSTILLAWAGGAGGGGAGGAGGANKTNHGGGDGGLGLTISISGSSLTYSIGGVGGGNATVVSPANTGKGGDAAYAAATAYAGATGVIIIRYPLN